MNSFAFSSDRPLQVLISAHNPEFKSHVQELVSRAYFNLHNTAVSPSESAWLNAIIASAIHICADERVKHFSTRELVHLFEDIIRVSEEHLHESRRHASMATNTFYLRETVLDNIAAHHENAPLISSNQSSVVRLELAHVARLRERSSHES